MPDYYKNFIARNEPLPDFGAVPGQMRTYSGINFNLLEPTYDMIDIDDIARGLAHCCHFAGQVPVFFSVAQHTHEVVKLVGPKLEHKRAALLHDASEAYTGDMIKPLKLLLPDFEKIEDRITETIFRRFGVSIDLIDEIKWADTEVQKKEYEQFFGNMRRPYYPTWGPQEAWDRFMKDYYELFRSKEFREPIRFKG